VTARGAGIPVPVPGCPTVREVRRQIRGGFTLLEVLVSLVLFGLVMTLAVQLFVLQSHLFRLGTERTRLTQAAQFVTGVLDRDLRTAGTNVVARQPWLVYAGQDVVAFHADYVSRSADPFAVYVDPDAPANQVTTLTAASAIRVPRTSFDYPDSTYWWAPSVPSPAELITFFMAPDTFTTRTDDFALFRQVNGAAAEAVVHGVLQSDSLPFFRYFRKGEDADGLPLMVPIPRAELPLMHSAPLHLAPGDTGVFARVDSVRAVAYAFDLVGEGLDADERRLPRRGLVWFRNGNLSSQRTCGSEPIFVGAPQGSVITADGAPAVRLRWAQATDEDAGERDVIRYVLWRTAPGQPVGSPFLSIPAGSATYEYVDSTVQPGESWIYSVAAQDCTPSISGILSTPILTVPVS